MTGKELRDTIKASGIELKKIADALKISPQALNSRLNAAVIKTDFADEIDGVLKDSLYSYKGTTNKPPIERSEVIPDPQIPGIYQDIVMELIESSKAQRRASEAMHEISRALLDERQLIKDTAQAAISLATRSQQEAETSSHMLERRQEILEDCVQDLQNAVVFGFSEVLKKTPEEIQTLLHSGWRGKPSGKKKQVDN